MRHLFTVSGPPASGTTTVASHLSNQFNLPVVSGGDIFREIADDRGMTEQELTKAAEDDQSIDRAVDDRLKLRIEEYIANDYLPEEDGLIIESRLAAWHAGDDATIRFGVTAPTQTRIERLSSRKGRAETPEQMQAREDSEAKRYLEYYGIDVTDLTIFDVLVDTGILNEATIGEVVTAAVENETALQSKQAAENHVR